MIPCNFQNLSFDELSTAQLHAILNLRSEAFVTEQICIYNDPDEQDKDAFHILGLNDKKLICYARIYIGSDKLWHMGRITVSKQFRGKGISSQLMQACIHFIHEQGGTQIDISAQAYLEAYYRSFGFKTKGNLYLEDGIPHLYMTYNQTLITSV